LYAAFEFFNLDWTKWVTEDATLLTRVRSARIGNPAKLRRLTGWQPSLSFVEMVHSLVRQVAACPEERQARLVDHLTGHAGVK
jgi:hypothetical protein